jgi:hypothetical protein
MKLAIVTYPKLSGSDRQWVESVRTRHDPQASRIDVHFTLVFPFDGTRGCVSEIASVAWSTSAISFIADHIEVVPDAMGHGHHIFLVPGKGSAQISALHDRLYSHSENTDIRISPLFLT